MTVSLGQAQRLAQLRKTKVMEGAFRVHNDHATCTFVLQSGHKLTMTSDELNKEIATLEQAFEREQAILAIDSQPKVKTQSKPKVKTQSKDTSEA